MTEEIREREREREPVPGGHALRKLVAAACDGTLSPELAARFGANLEDWDTHEVEDFSSAFAGRVQFDGDLSRWDVSRGRSFAHMFDCAWSFRGRGLERWAVSAAAATNLAYMFDGAASMDADLSEWDVSRVVSLRNAFRAARAFRGVGLARWDVAQVQDMRGAFSGALSLTADLSRWSTGNVTDMSEMFARAWAFDRDLSRWDTRNVRSMARMFYGASIFNRPLGNWDVGQVEDMREMFAFAAFFDQPLGDWDVRQVRSAAEMFRDARAFGQSLREWKLPADADVSDMFAGAERMLLLPRALWPPVVTVAPDLCARCEVC